MIEKERTSCGNFSLQTPEFSLHAVFSPFLHSAFPSCQTSTRKKTTDVQFEVDKQIPLFCPLDGIYRLYVLLPAGKISPLLDRAGFEKLHNRTSPIRGWRWGRRHFSSGAIALPTLFS
jgi:hypothetical protein